MHFLLVGNPNCGKTTLFNALTGENQRVGNWPGVTVEKKTGQFSLGAGLVQLTDLPGVYSLVSSEGMTSPDEQITAQAVLAMEADIILNIVDACHLERHLYLTSQLLELGTPVVIILNMTDLALQRGISIDSAALMTRLGCPVITSVAINQDEIDDVIRALVTPPSPASPLPLHLPADLQTAMKAMKAALYAVYKDRATYVAYRLLEGDTSLPSIPHGVVDADVLMADARYTAIHDLVVAVQHKATDVREDFTATIDKVVLHRIWGVPIFFGMMYLMFFFAIHVGGIFQDFFDITSDAVFVQGVGWLLSRAEMPTWLVGLCADGIGKGINTTLTFIPVMASMYFFLSLLESSGYMARAAFVVDKIMRYLGLPGKSFVPMIVGFGCNVPAIMAARTLDSERDRLLTVLMSPFMSCSARLAIYAVFVTAFFSTGGQNIIFSLYMTGILMAVFTGFILRKTLLNGTNSPLILELPLYHKPHWQRLFQETGRRLNYFIIRAGKLIIPVCIVLGGLNALTLHGGGTIPSADGQSLLSLIGHWLTPLFTPMGLHPDNWPATVGLFTGMLAKEVVIGSLNSLYAQLGGVTETAASFNFLGAMQAAVHSIPDHISQLGHALMHPLLSSASVTSLSQPVYGVMVSHFDGKAGAYAYLLFILLYIPCVSTMAAIRQEASRFFMWFSIAWSLTLAYASAVFYYQLATFNAHPWPSLFWLAVMPLFVLSFVLVLRWTSAVQTKRLGGLSRVVANP